LAYSYFLLQTVFLGLRDVRFKPLVLRSTELPMYMQIYIQASTHIHKVFSTLFNYSDTLDVLSGKARCHVTSLRINLATLVRFSGCLNMG